MDRPCPEPSEVHPDDDAEREFETRAEARQIERRRRQRAVDQAEASGRLCPYGAEYVAGTWPYDPV